MWEIMTIAIPTIDEKELVELKLLECVNEQVYREQPLFHALFEAQEVRSYNFSRFEIEESVFRNCILTDGDFSKVSFQNVVFTECDFSNSQFTEAYFERCAFLSCKGMGIKAPQVIFKRTSFKNCDLRYAAFDQAKMKQVFFEATDLTDAIITESELNAFDAVESKFVGIDFFKTPLKNIDFSRNEFSSPLVSSPPVELKGMTINMFQAANLIGLLGVNVVD